MADDPPIDQIDDVLGDVDRVVGDAFQIAGHGQQCQPGGKAFYGSLEELGFVIWGGKVLHQNTFRIGTIGRLFEADIRALLAAIGRTLDAMA